MFRFGRRVVSAILFWLYSRICGQDVLDTIPEDRPIGPSKNQKQPPKPFYEEKTEVFCVLVGWF